MANLSSKTGFSPVQTRVTLANNALTTVQNFAAYDAQELTGHVYVDATTDYRAAVKVTIFKNGAGTYEIAISDVAGDLFSSSPIVTFSISSAGVLSATLPNFTGFVSAYIQYHLSAPALGATFPLTVDSTNVAFTDIQASTGSGISFKENGGTAIGSFTDAGAWTFGPSSGLGTGAGAYHTVYGSIRGQSGATFRAVFGGSIEGYLTGNVYRDGSGNQKAMVSSAGATLVGAYATTTGTNTAFNIETSLTSTADSAVTLTQIGAATANGAWTLGNLSLDPSHSALGAAFNLTRGGNLGGAATVDFKASDASGTLAQIGGYKNTSNAAASGFMMARGTSGTTFYMYIGVNTGTWRTSSNSTDIGLNAGTVIGDQTSDIRLKENIENVSYGLAEVLQINPISFDMENRRQIGFSAQQVKDIIPEVVYDTGETIDESGQNKLAMQYANLSAVLVNAIKDLKAENNALKARIEALENA